ncbi:hypothetical protein HanPSC8_Chr06g0248661 [Helianthus annuus]|nr:hypothetical protein HanPSC8_Chr06g0248661 [Helianthus annuus]
MLLDMRRVSTFPFHLLLQVSMDQNIFQYPAEHSQFFSLGIP